MRASGNWVLGFHGCDKSVAEAAIKRDIHLKPSKNKYDWLGHGIYFWENDPNRALEWAKKSTKVKNPAIVGAIIDLGYCLNLTEVTNLELVRESFGILRLAYKISEDIDKMPENEPGSEDDQDLLKRNLDCMVINFLHDSRKALGKDPFDTVRSPFMEGKPLYEGAKIMSRTHIQICVRNNKQILGYFKPLF